MIQLGKVKLNGTPRVALAVKDRVPAAAVRGLAKQGVDIIELRIDQFSSAAEKDVLNEIKKYKSFPKIATLRARAEGGAWKGSEKERLSLFKAVIPKVEAVDIELSSKRILAAVVREARRKGKKIIVSYHNFSGTPSDPQLNQIFARAKKAGADIVKIAALVRRPADARRLAVFTLANAEKNLICIGMGGRGAVTRVLFPGLGSLITYAFLGKPTAPGQFDLRTTSHLLKKLYPIRG